LQHAWQHPLKWQLKDLLKAHKKREVVYAERLVKLEKGTGFYDPIKKLKLQTISSLMKETVIKRTAKKILSKAGNRVFGHTLLIVQNRKIDVLPPGSNTVGSGEC
jgi:hypothetical protein